MADHGIIYLIKQLLKTPESEEDFLIIEGFPAKQDLITALNQLKILKNLHPNTSLVDVSQYKQLSQSYASTALSIDNVKIITERLHSVANRAQFLSQQQDEWSDVPGNDTPNVLQMDLCPVAILSVYPHTYFFHGTGPCGLPHHKHVSMLEHRFSFLSMFFVQK